MKQMLKIVFQAFTVTPDNEPLPKGIQVLQGKHTVDSEPVQNLPYFDQLFFDKYLLSHRMESPLSEAEKIRQANKSLKRFNHEFEKSA